jgi:protein-L-isoaspartate(D-aspartate) O-methyltransferase
MALLSPEIALRFRVSSPVGNAQMKPKKPTRLAACREFYAKMAAAAGGQLRDDLERAFETVPREYFLGRGPWIAVSPISGIHVPTPTDDPVHVYQNVLFVLDQEKGINNGEPCLHGRLLGALSPTRGSVALHIGCGTGYYTAILAQLVGPSGRVVAYEIEPELTRRAAENLKPWDNVEVRTASGAGGDLPRCNAIYVNAGASRPAAGWLDALNEGGRLLFPLTGSESSQAGVSLLVTRLKDSFTARVLGYCGFIPCQGAWYAGEAAHVTAAVHSGQLWKAQSLVRSDQADSSAVLIGEGWWLSSSPAA